MFHGSFEKLGFKLSAGAVGQDFSAMRCIYVFEAAAQQLSSRLFPGAAGSKFPSFCIQESHDGPLGPREA